MEEQEGPTTKEPNSTRPLIDEWSVDDDMNLFDRIQNILPENDHLNFNKRIESLSWSKVKFKNYSSMDCKKRFIFVLTKLRTHKVLSEILKDAATSLDDDQLGISLPSKPVEALDDDQLGIVLPEKPAEACLLYFLEHKNEVLKQNPQLNPSIKEMKVISDVFESLDCEQKAVYMERAAKAKEAYQLKLRDLMNLPVKSDVARSELFRTMLFSCDIEEFFGKIIPNQPPSPEKLYFKEYEDVLLGQNLVLSFEEGGKKIVNERFLMNAELKDMYYKKYAIAMEEYRLKLKQQMKEYPDRTTVIGYTLNKKAEEFGKLEIKLFNQQEQNAKELEKSKIGMKKKQKRLDAANKGVNQDKALKSTEEYCLKLEQFLKENPEYYRVPSLLKEIKKSKEITAEVISAENKKLNLQAIQPRVTAKNLYYEELKAELLKQYPQLAIDDLNKIILGRPNFKSLNDEEKAKYAEKAAKAKIEQNLKIQSCLMKDIPNFPNKPEDPFMLYYKDQKDELSKQNTQLSDQDLRKFSEKKFNKLEEKEKYLYIENFRKKNLEYYLKLQELKMYYPVHSVEIDRRLKELIKGQPKIKSTRSEFYFLKNKAAFFKQINKKLPAKKVKKIPKDLQKIVNERLRSLDAEEKAVFEEKYLKYAEEHRLKWEKFMGDYPWYDRSASRPKPIEIKQSKRISATMKGQSDPTMKNVAPPVKVGTKRPATEDRSGELNQKIKKRRTAFEKMQNSSEFQLVAKAKPDGLKQKKKKKLSEGKVLNSSAKSGGLKQEKRKKKKSSAKKVVATIEVKVEQKASKQSGGLKVKKEKKKPSRVKVEQKASKQSGGLKEKKEKKKPSRVKVEQKASKQSRGLKEKKKN